MATNKDAIVAHYEDYTSRAGEDNRATSSRSAGLEFHYTKKAMSEHINANTRILEVGCGTGYYGMHFADKCKEYVGIDLFTHHIDIFQKKIQENGINNLSCRVGDATNLEGIENNSFDVVCCFGPMYHLPPEERELVFAECARVCKSGGIIAVAYINKIGAYASACLNDEWRSIYPSKKANEFILRLGTDDIRPGVFYFTMPEEMEASAVRHGLTKIRNLGTDFFNNSNIANQMDDEKFELFMEITDEMVKYESCTGISDHAVLICRK
ncbi:MAG: class I SAM-dependent methyltransferase [Defluviitaleaceae bacterium]|nr:class I SAM-dependent methyltransferase [Defluviitaleaceae bacterium]